MVYLKIIYPIDNPGNFEIESDIKPELRSEVISDFLRAQIGTGEDPRPTVDRKVYTILIQLDLQDDSFHFKSDTGNRGLTAGILMDVLNRLPENE
jgi:hypothetical protein